MDEESFTYAMLRRIERAENTSPRLSRLEPRFWERLGEHLTTLRQAFQDQQEEDPTSRRTVVLADELRNTQRLAESIWGFREKKVVQAALAATRKREGDSAVPEHVTPEERQLYTTVCGLLQRARDDAAITDPFSRRRQQAEAGLEKAAIAPSAAATSPPTATHTSSLPQHGTAVTVPVSSGGGHGQAAGPELHGTRPAGKGPGSPSGQEAQAPPLEGRGGMGAPRELEVELRLVEALADVPLFAGPDLVNYELARGEIGNLPARAAESLEKRGMVRLLPSG